MMYGCPTNGILRRRSGTRKPGDLERQVEMNKKLLGGMRAKGNGKYSGNLFRLLG